MNFECLPLIKADAIKELVASGSQPNAKHSMLNGDVIAVSFLPNTPAEEQYKAFEQSRLTDSSRVAATLKCADFMVSRTGEQDCRWVYYPAKVAVLDHMVVHGILTDEYATSIKKAGNLTSRSI